MLQLSAGSGPPVLMRQTKLLTGRDGRKEIIMSEEIKKAEAAAEAAQATTPTTDDDNMEAEMQLAAGRFEKLDLQADIQGRQSAYCSMIAEDNKARVTLYNACNQPEKLSAHINEEIKVLHVYIELIGVTNKLTGEIDKAPRVVLIDQSGKGYQAVSVGIYNAVCQLLHIFGEPGTWNRAHTVKVLHIPLEGGNHTMSLQVID